MVRMELPQDFTYSMPASRALMSMLNTHSKGVPELTPCDAYVTTDAQSAAAFSVLFRGHIAISSASMVRMSCRIWTLVYATPPSTPIHSFSVFQVGYTAAVTYAASNFCKAAARTSVRLLNGG